MSSHFIFEWPKVHDYDEMFLPKCDVMRLSMNVGNGKTYLWLNNCRLTSMVALDLMRTVVRFCDHLEEIGSDDPLGDYVRICEGDMELLIALKDAAQEREEERKEKRDAIRAMKGAGEKRKEANRKAS